MGHFWMECGAIPVKIKKAFKKKTSQGGELKVKTAMSSWEKVLFSTQEWRSFWRSKLCQVILWFYYKKVLRGEWVLYLDNGTRFIYHADSGFLPLSFSFSGITDFREMRFLSRYLRKGDVVFDCGAHQGLYSVYLAKLVGEEGRVIAIEPSQKFLFYLQKNAVANGLRCIEIYPFAAGNKKETKLFYENGPFSRLAPPSLEGCSTEVEVRPLEEILKPTSRYAFGKIDVEGAELFVLQGLDRMLKEGNPPVLQLEITKLVKDYGYSPHKLQEFLEDRGYFIYLYSPWSNRLLACSHHGSNCINFLAIHKEGKKFVLERLNSQRKNT
ncbi:FkbM family methyltransferase [Candidatus Methylacidiphilum infernorum]|uniref:FkbM family methyltransferase n=2 Tax=Candidatus Methylacidiphilum infernorum TaxID=511746 RepID=A0ABX7PXN4_9BACT|nr:FkbM family methyltransferase [Candidatus Methylacidiphilum infernorum]